MHGKALTGAERSLLDVLDAVDRNRFRLSCLLPGWPEDRQTAYARAVAQRVDELLLLPYGWSSPATSSPDAVASFQALYRRKGITLIHVNTLTLLDPLRAAQRCGLRALVHVRELLHEHPALIQLLGDTAASIHSALAESASLLLANSASTAASLGSGVNTRVLYNCVDDALFVLPPPRNGPVFRVGMVSCNGAHKGLRSFGDMARMVAARCRDVRFLLIGPETASSRALHAQAREQGFADLLECPGYIPEPVNALARLDLLLSLSEVPESFGRTLAEAKAAARPVLALARGAGPEVVRHGIDGYLIEPGAMQEAASRLITMAQNPQLRSRLGQAGREHASAHFSRPCFERGLRALHSSLTAPAQRLNARM